MFYNARQAWAEEAIVVAVQMRDGVHITRGGPWRSMYLPRTATRAIKWIRRCVKRSATREEAREQVIEFTAGLHCNDALRQHIDGRTYKKVSH